MTDDNKKAYLPNSTDLQDFPNLSQLFNKIDSEISKYIEENLDSEVDQTRVADFVAGHLLKEKLTDFIGRIKSNSAKRKVFDRDVYRSMAKRKLKDSKITPAMNALAKRIKIIVEEGSSADGTESSDLPGQEELRWEFEDTKKQMEEKKAKAPVIDRKIAYEKDLKKIKKDLLSIQDNYGAHTLLICANQNLRDQYEYRSFHWASSVDGYEAIDQMQTEGGFSLHLTLWKNLGTARRKSKREHDLDTLDSKKPRDLFVLFEAIALEKLCLVHPKSDTMDWSNQFLHGKIQNWPKEAKYNKVFGEDHSVDMTKLSKTALISLIGKFVEDEIKIIK